MVSGPSTEWDEGAGTWTGFSWGEPVASRLLTGSRLFPAVPLVGAWGVEKQFHIQVSGQEFCLVLGTCSRPGLQGTNSKGQRGGAWWGGMKR